MTIRYNSDYFETRSSYIDSVIKVLDITDDQFINVYNSYIPRKKNFNSLLKTIKV